MSITQPHDSALERNWHSRSTVTVEQAATILGISRASAYEAVKSGDLPGVIRIGRRRLVSVSALRRLLGEVD